MSEESIAKIKKRSEVDEQYCWKISDMFADNAIWEDDFAKSKAVLPNLAASSEKFTESAKNLLSFLNMYEEESNRLEKLYVFAHMRLYEDVSNNIFQELAGKARGLVSEFNEATAFFKPELIAMDEKTLVSYMEKEPELARYKHFVDFILLNKPHTLDSAQEAILAAASEMGQTASQAFSMFSNTDLSLGIIKDENGNDVEMTNGRYSMLMDCSDRRVRRDAFNSLHSSYRKFQNTLAENYSGCIKKDIFFARMRKYESSLHSFVAKDNVPPSVYKNLLKAVHESFPALHKYIELRKNKLNVDILHGYDLIAPIVEGIDTSMSYEQAQETILRGLTPLGAEYAGLLKTAFSSRWIDVYENEGKRSGAFQWGAYGTHPFVLMNFNNKFDDMMTLAHELGHAMHAYYTFDSQPYIYSETPIFLAEIASTVNEALLLKYLIKETTDKKMKMYLLNHLLDSFRSTVYRQTLFAEFELLAHETAEKGTPLTAKTLNTLYKKLLTDYYGSAFECTEENESEWSRIPHFYSPFYMYQYATGFSAAMAFSKMILEDGEPAVAKYTGFLKSGNSEYPIETLQKAGLDMSTPEVIRNGLSIFAETLDELIKLMEDK